MHGQTMDMLGTGKRVQILSALCEGASINSTVRMTGVAKNTVLKLLHDAGLACMAYHDKAMRDLPCQRIQADEIWSFCYAKDKNVPESVRGMPGVGSVWTWTAICADTKIVPAWLVAGRDAGAAHAFLTDLAGRLRHRVQLTTDGHRAYLEAADVAIGFHQIDYGMLVKIYGEEQAGEAPYSRPQCIGTRTQVIAGDPDPEHISTSHAERQNPTMRRHMRRFARLTNAFAKKLENHCHVLALYFTYYNFARIHQSLRVSPAMEAGVSDHLWDLHEIVSLVGD